MSLKLARGAIEYVKSQDGKIIEAYPTNIRSDNAPPFSTFMGLPDTYLQLSCEWNVGKLRFKVERELNDVVGIKDSKVLEWNLLAHPRSNFGVMELKYWFQMTT